MSKNVEVKAKISDFQLFLEKACILSDQPEVILHQMDTYFNVPNGRLKLRQIEGIKSELIYYNRPDTTGPKLSKYDKQEFNSIEETDGLKKVLISSLGLVGVVKKQRHLFMHGQTRIHVDKVDDLGCFMELEVCLKECETLEYGQSIANELMFKLGVQPEDLISGSYINLILKK